MAPQFFTALPTINVLKLGFGPKGKCMASEPEAPESRKVPQLYQLCWICGQTCALEACVTDEHGLAVHEECYANKLSERLRQA